MSVAQPRHIWSCWWAATGCPLSQHPSSALSMCTEAGSRLSHSQLRETYSKFFNLTQFWESQTQDIHFHVVLYILFPDILPGSPGDSWILANFFGMYPFLFQQNKQTNSEICYMFNFGAWSLFRLWKLNGQFLFYFLFFGGDFIIASQPVLRNAFSNSEKLDCVLKLHWSW